MNFTIHNFRNFRVSDSGTGQLTLFNRETDRVFFLSRNDYQYIFKGRGGLEAHVGRCEDIENEHLNELTKAG